MSWVRRERGGPRRRSPNLVALPPKAEAREECAPLQRASDGRRDEPPSSVKLQGKGSKVPVSGDQAGTADLVLLGQLVVHYHWGFQGVLRKPEEKGPYSLSPWECGAYQAQVAWHLPPGRPGLFT